MSQTHESAVAVVVSTRNRGAMIGRTIQSLQCGNHTQWEMIIVDQSDGDETEKCVAKFLSDARLRYQRSTSRGLSAGRNIGVRSSGCELIAMTDDDCAVEADWLDELSAAIRQDPRIGVVLGNVTAGPHDRGMGFIPGYVRSAPYLARSLRDKWRVEGIGACMGLRRSCWERLGGFDPLMGGGGRFRSADETDFIIRALAAGFLVLETPGPKVVHHGFRTWAQGTDLIRDYLYGLGAAYAKQVRCRHWSICPVIARMALRWAFSRPAVDFGRRPPRLLRLAAFIAGACAGCSTSIDGRTGLYSAGFS